MTSTFMAMKRLLLALTICITCLAEESDKVRMVLTALSHASAQHNAKAFAQFFAADGQLIVGNEVIGTGPAAIEKALKETGGWSEVSSSSFEKESIRFPSRNVALVDAVRSRYGSVILKQSEPVTMVLKRKGGRWQVSSLRYLCNVSVTDRCPTF